MIKHLPQSHSDKKYTRGFIVPLTLIITMIMLSIATGVSVLLAKELYFSRLSRLSHVAYYAADAGLMCATMIDDEYVDPTTGVGIFEYDTLTTSQQVINRINVKRGLAGLSAIQLNDIECAASEIFDNTVTGMQVVTATFTDPSGNSLSGRTTTFTMHMDLGDGSERCAEITVNKTSAYRQIISRGYASCDSSLAYPVERAVISTSEVTPI